MKQRAPKLVVPKDEPFKNDELGRKKNGVTLTQFLKVTEEPLVLSIDAEWGQGKTTFIRMWRQMLKNENFPTLYYSAWENDYNNDALVTIIGELEEEIDQLIGADGSKKERINQRIDDAKEIGSKILANSLPFILKIVTSGLIDFGKLDGDEFGDMVKSLAEKQIKDYQESKKEIEEFKENLCELAKDLAPENEYRPLVIFIDELDRCRPTFAIEVLERIKHLFDAPNVVFVLAIDKKQLIESIKTVYGTNLNSSGYLKRFIDIEYSLPKPDSEKYSKVLVEKFELESYISDPNNQIQIKQAYKVLEYIINMITSFDCSLREVEKCFSKIVYALKITNRGDNLYPLHLSFLTILSIKEGFLFKKFKNDEISVDDLFTTLQKRSNRLNEFVRSNQGILLWALLLIANNTRGFVEEKGEKMKKLLSDSDAPINIDKELVRQRREMLDSRMVGGYGFNMKDRIIEKIEMVSDFRY